MKTKVCRVCGGEGYLPARGDDVRENGHACTACGGTRREAASLWHQLTPTQRSLLADLRLTGALLDGTQVTRHGRLVRTGVRHSSVLPLLRYDLLTSEWSRVLGRTVMVITALGRSAVPE